MRTATAPSVAAAAKLDLMRMCTPSDTGSVTGRPVGPAAAAAGVTAHGGGSVSRLGDRAWRHRRRRHRRGPGRRPSRRRRVGRRPVEKTCASSRSISMWTVSPFMGGLRASTRRVRSLSPSCATRRCAACRRRRRRIRAPRPRPPRTGSPRPRRRAAPIPVGSPGSPSCSCRPASAAIVSRGKGKERSPRSGAVGVERDVDEVHRRGADEAGDEHVVRLVVEVARGVHLLQVAVLEHAHPVAHRHGLDLVVGDVDGGDPEPPLQRGDLGAGLHAQLRVEVGQRLVHQERLRVAHDRPAHRHPLPLPARQRLGLAVEVRARGRGPSRPPRRGCGSRPSSCRRS